ncbi:MAG: hypothetical protein ACHQEA_13300, partial [Gaiellales bacterium]
MVCPSAVRRGLLRVAAGTTILVALVALGALPWSRVSLGWTAEDTKTKVHDDLRSRIGGLGRVLDAAVAGLTGDAAAVEAGAAGSTDAVRTLFDRVAALQTANAPLAALTIYDDAGVPLAWDGRPASLPTSRLVGGAATFLVPTPLGLR